MRKDQAFLVEIVFQKIVELATFDFKIYERIEITLEE
jgi:hypothetical protein